MIARTEGDVLVDDAPSDAMRPISGGARRRWLPPELLSIILLLGLWELVPRLFNSPWLPSFSDVVTALGEIYDRGLLVENVLASLRSLSIGYAISVVVGLVVGSLMGRYKVVEAALDVFVEAALFTPSLILAPIFFAIFGLGDETRIAVVVAYAPADRHPQHLGRCAHGRSRPHRDGAFVRLLRADVGPPCAASGVMRRSRSKGCASASVARSRA